MADNEPIDVDALLKLMSNGADISKVLGDMTTLFSGLGSATTSFDDRLKALNVEVTNTNAGFGKTSNSSAIFSRDLLNVGLTAKAFFAQVAGGSTAFASLNKAVSDSSGSIKKSFDELGDLGKGMASRIGLGTVAEAIGKKLEDVVAASDRVQGMEKNVISLASATGQLDSVFDTSGKLVGNIDSVFSEFNDKIFDASQATGLSVGTITEATKSLGQVPEALSKSIVAGTQTMSELVAVTKIASATGKDNTDIIKEISDAYKNLGLNGQGAVDFLSSIAMASSNLHIPLDDVNHSITSLANQYAFLTNKTDGAVRAFAQFVPALQGVGLSPQRAIEMFDQMTKSVSGMTTASKAFLAQSSGLGSGLQGAFKIDKMIQDGKIDEVLQDLQKNMQKRFGGRVVTLDQASTSQRDAVQYQRQLEYAKSDAFGGLIKDDKQASKFFEAMKNGSLNKSTAGVLTGGDATRAVVERGSSSQDRMRTILGPIATDVQRIAAAEDQQLAFLSRRFIGTADSSPANKQLLEMTAKYTAETGNVNKIKNVNPENRALDLLRTVDDDARNLAKSYVGDKDQFGNVKTKKENIPPARGPNLAPAVKDANTAVSQAIRTAVPQANLSAAVNQNIKQNQIRSAVSTQTISSATDNTNQRSSNQNNVPSQISVKGTIEGFCINCKQNMEVGHIEETVIKAVDASSDRDRARRTMPAYK